MKEAGSIAVFTTKELNNGASPDSHLLLRRRRRLPLVCCSADDPYSYSPLRPCSGVPFSWERSPGVPKSIATNISAQYCSEPLHLPPPPSLIPTTTTSEKARPAGSWQRKVAGWGAALATYGSCKTACSESTVYIPRATVRSGSYGLLSRR